MAMTPDELEQAVQRETDRLAEEFRGKFSRETIELCVRDSLEKLAGARVTIYSPIFAHRFARERLKLQAGPEGIILSAQPRVLFVCTHNAARSQMAAALMRHLSRGEIETHSAGSQPAEQIDPTAVPVMDELGFPIADEFPKLLPDDVLQAADVVVTMDCGDACALYPFKKYQDWPIPDPRGESIETVRAIRDDICARVEQLLAELLPQIVPEHR
jgi:protein-tyrosine-phosphatase